MKAQPLDLPALRAELTYDPTTGEVRVKDSKAREAVTPLGYKRIFWRNKFFRCHRVAWALFYNEQPPEVIDHINGIGTDNRIENLRAATFSQNKQNSRRYKNNKTGIHGVYWIAKAARWIAVISQNGKTRSLGRYKAFEDACKARRLGELETFGAFAPQHNFPAGSWEA